MLGLLNTRKDLKEVLKKSTSDILVLDDYIDPAPALSGLFIDWIEKSNPKFAVQGIYVEHYAKAGVPIVLFDRHLSLNNTEYSWLKKFNITFMEPALKHRAGFQWLPTWVESPIVFKYDIIREEKKYTLTYDGSITDKTASFDKYYKRTAEILPSTHEICYRTSDISDLKVEDLKKVGIYRTDVTQYNNAYATILIGSPKDYLFGMLPDDLFDIMKAGCTPLLPIEHRFFCSGFFETTISNERDLQFLVKICESTGKILIEETCKNLLNKYPEFDINFTAERIKGLLL